MVQNIRDLLHRHPFEPFRVVLSSGDVYDVPHPEFAWPVKGGLYVGLPGKGNSEESEIPHRAVYCSALHIAAIEHVNAS
jgi:hypothetical protein